ncbi:MAG: CDP-glucose 4,6-dehydratase, partial [Syntrophales bacterium]|nr:CDP-glucose 4,6-dehydratase [Syntrophales bacterium]
PLRGYLMLAQALLHDPIAFSGPWNFGPLPSDSLTVRALVEQFIAAWGHGDILTSPGEDTPAPEANVLRLHIDKALALLRWRPMLDIIHAIAWTAEWYKAWHGNTANLREISLGQIRQMAQPVLP